MRLFHTEHQRREQKGGSVNRDQSQQSKNQRQYNFTVKRVDPKSKTSDQICEQAGSKASRGTIKCNSANQSYAGRRCEINCLKSPGFLLKAKPVSNIPERACNDDEGIGANQ